MFLKALKKVRSILVVIPLVLLSFMMSSYVDSYFEISKNLDIFITLFKELNLYYVDDTQPGDLVEKGDIIGLVGSSGRSTGPHVHFEITHNGKSVNPAKYLE